MLPKKLLRPGVWGYDSAEGQTMITVANRIYVKPEYAEAFETAFP